LGENGLVTHGPAADLLWVYRRRRRQWLEEWRRGECSSEFFYGLPAFRHRHRVGFIEEERANPFLRPWYPFEWLIARRVGMGFALDVCLRNLSALNRARVVISTVDSCGLPLALLKRARLLRRPLIYISQGLSDRIGAYGPDRWLARRYRRLLLGVEQLVTLSAGARSGLAAWLGVPDERVRVLPFGTDCEFWRNTAPAESVETRIVSVGSDAGRDYATLLAAAGDLPVHIITAQRLPLDGHPSVVRSTRHAPRELRDIYSSARFVVIPLHDRSQPSGQSAALQAMACGKAVIVTRTRGWWGEAYLRDGEHCVLVPPGDADAVRRAMQRLWSDPAACRRIGANAREVVVEHFGEPRMVAALSELISARL
jgi:glycosyltransferase involved in cell wall biosynthesis